MREEAQLLLHIMGAPPSAHLHVWEFLMDIPCNSRLPCIIALCCILELQKARLKDDLNDYKVVVSNLTDQHRKAPIIKSARAESEKHMRTTKT